MLVLDDVKFRLKAVAAEFDGCLSAFDTEKLKGRLEELTTLQHDPDLYKDVAAAQKINSEAKQLGDTLKNLERIEGTLKELDEIIDMAESEDAADLIPEIESSLKDIEAEVSLLNLTTLLKGEYDDKNAILMIHAGAGGTEAMDWAGMLYRMYRMYADKSGFGVELIDFLQGEEAGYKSVTFTVKGKNAYGFLKAEKGVHRLVRISPFDSSNRRHTSFASVEVMPEIEGDMTIKISPEELKIDTYRSSGPGGQHVNKTDSAVRITHLPSGIVTQSQNGRSQIQNREVAMNMLKSKLAEKKEREMAEKLSGIKGEIKKIEWGSQIRSYVFQPYTLVKDHRTGYEQPDIARVMNGEIEEFIFDFLRKS